MSADRNPTFFRLLGFGAVRRVGDGLYALELDPMDGVHIQGRSVKELSSLFSLRADLVDRAEAFLRRRELDLDPEAAAATLRQNARGLSFPDFPELEKEAKAEIRKCAQRFDRLARRRVTT